MKSENISPFSGLSFPNFAQIQPEQLQYDSVQFIVCTKETSNIHARSNVIIIMKFLLTFLLACSAFLLLQCNHSYKLIVGKTYFEETSNREYSLLADLQKQTVLTLKGVYSKKRIGRKWLPAVFSYSSKGVAYTVLTDTLSANDNAYIQIKGKPVSQKMSFGLKDTGMELKVIQVSEFQQLFQTAPFITQSIKEYNRIHNKFESSLKPDHAKDWKFVPHWRSVINEEKGQVIVFSRTSDLMYQYEINFIYQLKNGSLRTVYCRRWFKGE